MGLMDQLTNTVLWLDWTAPIFYECSCFTYGPNLYHFLKFDTLMETFLKNSGAFLLTNEEERRDLMWFRMKCIIFYRFKNVVYKMGRNE